MMARVELQREGSPGVADPDADYRVVVRERCRAAVRARYEEMREVYRLPYEGEWLSREDIMARQRRAWWKGWINLADVLIVLAGGFGIAWVLLNLILSLVP
jgi:hypothetical protein